MKPYESFPVIASDLASVDRIIQQRLDSDVALIRTIGNYIIGAGGKRLRPVLLLLFARALGYGDRSLDDPPAAGRPSQQHHWLLAAVVEFIHTATLLHDDVVDESTLRRGRATANAEFGNASAVLVGDFLYSRAFQMMVEPADLKILKTIADATNTIAEGEVMQLLNCHDPEVAEADYMRVIQYKTAKLFEAASRIGAILAGADDATEEAAATYGRHLGTAFQLIDDVLDYSSSAEEMGKNVGDDLREGKPTLPLIRIMQVGMRPDRDMVADAIRTGTVVEFERIRAAIERADALNYTAAVATREAEIARAAISSLPDTEHKQALLYFAAYSVSRKT